MKHLIIGGGSIGKLHLLNLKALKQDELFCLRREHDAEFEKEYNARVLTSAKQVVNIDPDIIYICNPTSLHAEALDIAVSCGAHVFMEKPLTHSLESLNAIRANWKDDTVFFIGFMLRFHPFVKVIEDKLSEGVIGDVYNARFEFGSYLPSWHPWEDYKKSYAARKDLGGGVINTITHELDLIQYYFGDPTAVTAVKRNLGKLSIEVEEIAEAIFEYPDKLVTLHLDYLQKDYHRQVNFFGSEGKIRWNWHNNKLIVDRHRSGKEIIELKEVFDVNQLYVDELKHFLKLVENNVKMHLLDLDHAVRNTELILAIHQSAEETRKLDMH